MKFILHFIILIVNKMFEKIIYLGYKKYFYTNDAIRICNFSKYKHKKKHSGLLIR